MTQRDAAVGPPECTTEASQLGRLVALASPFFAIFTGWVAAWVAAHVPGVQLDQGQVTAFMVSATTAALSSSWKWLQGWQQHELLVARGEVAPRRHVHGARCGDRPASASPSTRSTAPDDSGASGASAGANLPVTGRSEPVRKLATSRAISS